MGTKETSFDLAVFLLSDIIMKELKRYCKKYNIGYFKKLNETK